MISKASALAAVILLASSAESRAAAPTQSNVTTSDFHVETDETHYNLKSGNFTMPHHVHFTRPGTDVTGDSAVGNSQRGTLTITGHVVLHQIGSLDEVAASSKVAQAPSTLMTDQLAVDSKRKLYVADGTVRFTQDKRLATADHGVLDQPGHALDLKGNVHIEDGAQTLNAQTVHYDTLTENVDVHGAPVIITAPVASPLPGIPKPSRSPKPKR